MSLGLNFSIMDTTKKKRRKNILEIGWSDLATDVITALDFTQV